METAALLSERNNTAQVEATSHLTIFMRGIFFYYLQSQKREYMIINATKRGGGKTCVIEPLTKVLTIIDQIHLGEIWHEKTYKF